MRWSNSCLLLWCIVSLYYLSDYLTRDYTSLHKRDFHYYYTTSLRYPRFRSFSYWYNYSKSLRLFIIDDLRGRRSFLGSLTTKLLLAKMLPLFFYNSLFCSARRVRGASFGCIGVDCSATFDFFISSFIFLALSSLSYFSKTRCPSSNDFTNYVF